MQVHVTDLHSLWRSREFGLQCQFAQTVGADRGNLDLQPLQDATQIRHRCFDFTVEARCSVGRGDETEYGELGAARQLRGDQGDRQVKRHDVALVHNEGGILSSNCTMLLGREAR